MKKIFVDLEKEKIIMLGRQGEKNVTAVIWDISQWIKDYGEGSVTLLYSLEGAENIPYPCQVTVNGGEVEWLITPTELMLGRRGKCQLVYSVGDEIVGKSPVYRTRVQGSLGEETTDPPESFTGWVDDVLKASALSMDAAKRAEDVASQLESTVESAENQIIQAGSQAVQAVEETTEEKIGQIQAITAQIPSVTEEDNGKVMMVVDGKWTAVEPNISSWEKVQLIVRAGLAPQYFPVGYEFITHDSTEDTDIIWRVIGFDTIKAADESLTHSMILETKYAYSHKEGYARTIMYGFKDALYYAETGLTPGTYHFTLSNTYLSDGGGKTYSFTLTQPVPVGGLVDFEWFHGQQVINSLIKTYASPMDIVPIETVQLTEGNNGTYLGTSDGTSVNMNIDSRVRYGSNNYAQSVVRKWLNTDQLDPFVWATPETKFNRFPKLPGMTLENSAGFLSGLPEDFLAAVQTAVVPNKSNAVFETASLDGTIYELDTVYHTYDKFFLLHSGEISEGNEGFEVLEYYKGSTNVDQIKYAANGTAVNYWLRSCHSTQPAWASSILTTGAPNSAGTTNVLGICPVCIIA